MIFDRTKEQRFKVEEALEKRREKYYYQVGETIGLMTYLMHLRGGNKRWAS